MRRPPTTLRGGCVGKRVLFTLFTLGFVIGTAGLAGAQTTGRKPNILVIWGDDIGYWNSSTYNQGISKTTLS
jgi:hypothetical protein